MEVIDLDLEPISLSMREDSRPSTPATLNNVGFGGGFELLMNDKKRGSTNSVNVDLGDLDRLESELNELSGVGGGSSSKAQASASSSNTKSLSGFASSLFGFGGGSAASAAPAVDTGYEKTDSKLGQSTSSSLGNTKTWDGFTKVNEIPPESANARQSSSAGLNEREKRRKKREMIKKLEEWQEKGQLKHSSRFTMDSAFEEVEDEYETVLEDKRRKDGCKLYGWWFLTLVNSLEYANSAFNPFDINLDGWGEQVSEDMESYDEIFSELHDKYKGGKLAPELALLMRLGFSAAVVGISNKALSSATPGFNDVMKQNPELMRMFTNATVQTMSNQNPGFAFANTLLNPDSVNNSFGPPPKSVETKNSAPARPMQYTTNVNNDVSSSRPDLAMGRGTTMFRENGVEIGSGYMDVNKSAQPTTRPEMRGPGTDIDGILSGLKTRTVNIHEQTGSGGISLEDDSMISVSSLKDLASGGIPKKSNRRKNRSDKNAISLDI
jgi:hypothetical protein